MPNEIKVKELSTKEIKNRENKKTKKNRKKEMYKIKGTDIYVTYLGPQRSKKREVK